MALLILVVKECRIAPQVFTAMPLFLGNYTIASVWEELYQQWKAAFFVGEAGVYE